MGIRVETTSINKPRGYSSRIADIPNIDFGNHKRQFPLSDAILAYCINLEMAIC